MSIAGKDGKSDFVGRLVGPGVPGQGLPSSTGRPYSKFLSLAVTLHRHYVEQSDDCLCHRLKQSWKVIAQLHAARVAM